MWILAFFGLGCATTDCAAVTGTARATCLQARCDGKEQLAHDACLLDQIGATDLASDVIALAPTVQDPLIRDAAIIRWSTGHRRDVAPADARTLCGLVTKGEVDACLRRLSSAHLSR